MTNLAMTIAPKSDQLNADDLLSGSITIRVTKVSGSSEPQQPISIHYEGDNGKPYKPCKSMRRVLVKAWGADGNQYAGRSMTLYLDPTVTFGGIAVGGIRISRLSDIKGTMEMALTASKTVRKIYKVQELVIKAPVSNIDISDLTKRAETAAKEGMESYQKFWSEITKENKAELGGLHSRFKKTASEADQSKTTDPVAEKSPSCPKCNDTGMIDDFDGKGPCDCGVRS